MSAGEFYPWRTANIPEPGRIDDLVAEIENRQGIDYAPEQRSAIRAAASPAASDRDRRPRHGKTTVMSGILRLFDALRLKDAAGCADRPRREAAC